MVVCEKCSEGIEFDMPSGWRHVGGDKDHAIVVSNKIKNVEEQERPEVPTLAYGAGSADHHLMLRTLRHRMVHDFLAWYYFVNDSLPWEKVRKHDAGLTCHCVTCKRECVVCNGR